MKTSSTRPLADTPWRYTITVKNRAGKPLAAKVRLQILLGTLVVGLLEAHGHRALLRRHGRHVDLVQGQAHRSDQVAGAVGRGQADVPGDVVAMSRSLKLRAPVRVQLP